MKFKLPKIYAITDTGISGISHEEQTALLIHGGVRLIQLRDKRATAREFYEAAKAVMNIARKYQVGIIINDRVDIALTLGADGVHLGQTDLPPEHARKILGPEAIIGFSAHSVEQARAALSLPIDYVAIGPVFATETKENPDPVVGIDGIGKVRSEIGKFPLVAIGGITGRTVLDVLRNGADSAAMIGALISDPKRIAEAAHDTLALVEGD